MDADQKPAGPWNPGIQSQIPRELLPLCTIFRPEHVLTSIASAEELHAMTGFALSELVVFRPQRLALHELLIRVTADFAVPDGLQIGDLGINFRRIAGHILTHYLEPEMDLIVGAFERARADMADAIEARSAHLRARTRAARRAIVASPGAPAVFPGQAAPWRRSCARRAGLGSRTDRGIGARREGRDRRAAEARAPVAGPSPVGVVHGPRSRLGYPDADRATGAGHCLQHLRERRRRPRHRVHP